MKYFLLIFLLVIIKCNNRNEDVEFETLNQINEEIANKNQPINNYNPKIIKSHKENTEPTLEEISKNVKSNNLDEFKKNLSLLKSEHKIEEILINLIKENKHEHIKEILKIYKPSPFSYDSPLDYAKKNTKIYEILEKAGFKVSLPKPIKEEIKNLKSPVNKDINYELIKYLNKKNKLTKKEKYKILNTSLFFPITGGNNLSKEQIERQSNIIRLILSDGLDLNKTEDKDICNGLLYCVKENIEVMKSVLDIYPDINYKTKLGTILEFLFEQEIQFHPNIEKVKLLIDVYGAKIEDGIIDNLPIGRRKEERKKYNEIYNYLKKKGAKYKNPNLQRIIFSNQLVQLKKLPRIHYEIDELYTIQNIFISISLCLEKNNFKGYLKVLIQKGVDINLCLYQAIIDNNYKAYKYIIGNGANLNKIPSKVLKNSTIIDLAKYKSKIYYEIKKSLDNSIKPINSTQNLDEIKQIIVDNPKAVEKIDQTELVNYNLDVLRYLLKNNFKFNTNKILERFWFLIDFADEKERFEKIKFLYDNKILVPNYKYKNCPSYMHYYLKSKKSINQLLSEKNFKILDYYISIGWKYNDLFYDRKNIFHVILKEKESVNTSYIIKYFLDKNIYKKLLNQKDKFNKTPLDYTKLGSYMLRPDDKCIGLILDLSSNEFKYSKTFS